MRRHSPAMTPREMRDIRRFSSRRNNLAAFATGTNGCILRASSAMQAPPDAKPKLSLLYYRLSLSFAKNFLSFSVNLAVFITYTIRCNIAWLFLDKRFQPSFFSYDCQI